jgi:cytochrome b
VSQEVSNHAETTNKLVRYAVWDRTTRLFHWINFVCIVALAILGLAILNDQALVVSSDGNFVLKTLHVYVGYVFALNLAWRLIWGFIGGPYARWKRLLPVGGRFSSALREHLRGLRCGRAPSYLGHNPLGRLMVTLLLLIMVTQATTGLVLAGTDLYKAPFGRFIAAWVTRGDPDKLAHLAPGSKEHVDLEAYDEMRNFRSPVAATHLYGFYVLMAAVFLHISGVVVSEIRERHGLTSAMITGEKVLSSPPVDDQTAQSLKRPES